MSFLNGSSPRRTPPQENDIEAGPATRRSSDDMEFSAPFDNTRNKLWWMFVKDIELSYNQIDQDINGSQRTQAQSESESGIEIETDPSESEVIGMITIDGPQDTIGADINEKINKILSAGYIDLHYVCQIIMTPMGNTVLHIAAWYGNDHVVDVVAQHAPDVLFCFNKNEDTPLHVAARAGNIQMVEKLLATYANFQSQGIAEAWKQYKKRISKKGSSMGGHSAEININTRDLLDLVRKKNIAQGNTMLHEAMLCGKLVNILPAFEPYKIKEWGVESSILSESCNLYILFVASRAKQSVLYLAVEAGDREAVKLILEKAPRFWNDQKPTGLSPMVAAIMKQNADMLKIILDMKPNWIHLMDKHGRLPLHYAASTGFLEGVIGLLNRCECCRNRKDKYGYFPLHLASHGGHEDVVKVLLRYCPNPTEMLDSNKRNILHIASKSGKHKVARYILQSTNELHYEMMINQRDSRGDTPLHLATRYCHPVTVFHLTWDDRAYLCAVNEKKETALDVANALYQSDRAHLRQQLVWIALKSAGVPSSSRVLPKPSHSKPDEKSPEKKLSSNDDKAVQILSVVLTLIITASVAACLAVPGDTDDKGRAHNINHVMFQIFIICITISLFSALCAIIILFWAQFGIFQLVSYSLRIVMPLQGLALFSLSLAFLAGIYTVINKLSWLATLFLVMAGIFVLIELSLYILLYLPSSSTNKLLRYMSYYPFLFLASLAESEKNQGTTTTGFQLLGFEAGANKQ